MSMGPGAMTKAQGGVGRGLGDRAPWALELCTAPCPLWLNTCVSRAIDRQHVVGIVGNIIYIYIYVYILHCIYVCYVHIY